MAKSQKDKEKLTWQQTVVLYLHDLVYLLIVIMLLFLLVFRIIIVSGDSMDSTLWDGDYLLLLSNVFYTEPEQGDIVVISKRSFDNGQPIVKRVIATEGQTVDIDSNEGIVYVNGMALDERYISGPTYTDESNVTFPLTVRENCIFVLGDNRSVSLDSRYPVLGQIDNREVLGKALYLFLPGTSHGNRPVDFGRIGVIK